MTFDYAKSISSKAIFIPDANVDTDQMVPARFLADGSVNEYGQAFFHDWRFNKDGREKQEHPFKSTKNRTILITGPNFGCGSSREHAVWALRDFGIRILIGTSFGDIFKNNCYKNQVLAITVDNKDMKDLANTSDEIKVDLTSQLVRTSSLSIRFELDPFIKLCLLSGLDQTSYILEKQDAIEYFEKRNDNSTIKTDSFLTEAIH